MNMCLSASEVLTVLSSGAMVGAVALAPALGGVPYLHDERRWRWRWQEIRAGSLPASPDGGAYRESIAIARYLPRAPGVVRWAALSSLMYGQSAIVLTFFAALLVPMAGGLGFLLAPWLILGVKRWRAGRALLRRDPRTAFHRCLSTGKWGFVLGTVTLILSIFAALGAGRSLEPLAFLLIGWSIASTLQAMLLLHVAARHQAGLLAPTEAI